MARKVSSKVDAVHGVREHLAHGVSVQPEHPGRLPDAHPLHQARPAHAQIHVHDVHPMSPSIRVSIDSIGRWQAVRFSTAAFRLSSCLRGTLSLRLGLSVTDAAAHLGVSRKQLSDVLNGHSGISPEMAVRLDKDFGGGASAWYQLQAAYDLAQVMKRADQIDVKRVA